MANSSRNDLPLTQPAKRQHSPSSPVEGDRPPSISRRLPSIDPNSVHLLHNLAPWPQIVPLASFLTSQAVEGSKRYQYSFALFQNWLEETRPLGEYLEPAFMKVVLRDGTDQSFDFVLVNHWALHALATTLVAGRVFVPSHPVLGHYLTLVPVEDGDLLPPQAPIDADLYPYSPDQLNIASISLPDEEILPTVEDKDPPTPQETVLPPLPEQNQ